MMREVLVGYDGSDSSRGAVMFAADLADRYGACLHVLAVAQPPELDLGRGVEPVVQQHVLHCEELLAEIKSVLPIRAEPIRFEVAVGSPAEEIVSYAKEFGIDHIVVGHRGHTLLERWLIGSVAKHVIVHAPCAVTVVRN